MGLRNLKDISNLGAFDLLAFVYHSEVPAETLLDNKLSFSLFC